MPWYSLYTMCDECVDAHRLDAAIEIVGGPSDITSISDAFEGRPLPPDIKAILEKPTFCTKARRLINQNNPHRIYLVPKDSKESP